MLLSTRLSNPKVAMALDTLPAWYCLPDTQPRRVQLAHVNPQDVDGSMSNTSDKAIVVYKHTDASMADAVVTLLEDRESLPHHIGLAICEDDLLALEDKVGVVRQDVRQMAAEVFAYLQTMNRQVLNPGDLVVYKPRMRITSHPTYITPAVVVRMLELDERTLGKTMHPSCLAFPPDVLVASIGSGEITVIPACSALLEIYTGD